MYCTHLIVCHLDKAVTRRHIKAVVENASEYLTRYFVQCVAGNTGPLQDRLQSAGAHWIVGPFDVEQQTRILHGICQHLRFPVALIDLHIQIAQILIPCQGTELQALRGGCHPCALCFPLLQKLNKLV